MHAVGAVTWCLNESLRLKAKIRLPRREFQTHPTALNESTSQKEGKSRGQLLANGRALYASMKVPTKK